MACCNIQILTSLAFLLWTSTIISVYTQDVQCFPLIRVPRNTVWRAAPTETLTINCTVETEPRCLRNLTVSWCKLDEENKCRSLSLSGYLTTEWKNINKASGILFLIFRNLSTENAGLYRCSVNASISTVSHAINVTITDDSDAKFSDPVSNENKTTTNASLIANDLAWILPYVYICSGILVMVIIVMAIPLFIHCQRTKQSRKKKNVENQPSTTQLPDHTQWGQGTSGHPRGNSHTLPPQASPSSPCIYDNTPIRASSQKARPSAGGHHTKQVAPRQSYDHRTVSEEEEESPLVYASLNHKAMKRGQVRISHPESETSEYAAIRVS